MIKKEKLLIVGNWKANPDSLRLAKSVLSGIQKISVKSKNVEVVICPPVIYLESLRSGSRGIALGAQDFFPEPNGAFTGNVGYLSLLETKIKYVIIGHSERREAGETDAGINKKLKVALSVGLNPILCIGEKDRAKDMEYLSVLKQQLLTAFQDVPKAKVRNVSVAYEPVWAIGKSATRSARPEEIKEVVIFIRRVIGDLYKTSAVPPVRIIYGASVDGTNARYIIEESGVGGLLVGRASLTPKAWGEILKAVSEIKYD